MHELATNAIKYGALSVPDGYVSIHWAAEPEADGNRITIEWKEHGGPVPVPPEREGFGGRVIKSVPAREKNGRGSEEWNTRRMGSTAASRSRRRRQLLLLNNKLQLSSPANAKQSFA